MLKQHFHKILFLLTTLGVTSLQAATEATTNSLLHKKAKICYNFGINSVVFTKDNAHIIIGAMDGIHSWYYTNQAEEGNKPVKIDGNSVKMDGNNAVNSVTFFKDENDKEYIVSGSKGIIEIWELKKRGNLSHHSSFKVQNSVTSVAVFKDKNKKKYIISGSDEDKTIRIWDLTTGQEHKNSPLTGHTNGVTSVAVTSDNKYIVSGSKDNTIRIWWDFDTDKEVKHSVLKGHTNGVTSVAVTSDNKYIVSGSEDNTIGIWELKTGMQQMFSSLTGHNGPVTSVAVTSDNKYIVSGSEDNTIRIWELKTGDPVGEPLKGHENWVNSVAVTSNNRYIVSSSKFNGKIFVWDLKRFLKLNNKSTFNYAYLNNPTYRFFIVAILICGGAFGFWKLWEHYSKDIKQWLFPSSIE